MALYDNIKKFAKLRGMSLQVVAEKAGLSKNIIYQYKHAKSPSLENLTKISQVLGVSTADLIGEKRQPSKRDIDLKQAMHDNDTVVAWDGKPIPPEEMEMIRRILDGGK
ncbi:helix-turn-helix domain-containing protein [Schleiferilactobacillus harbinensis]|uniref:helix-turn-helix domain-containing protein n=1 Tax=Schleiferilactobacillus harbinensis TaxID=304207 RepID=UPI0011741460|nr:helix-turn-helix transcriptional regulator [Schleiferilactobacillus harbinensis]GEK06119.1 hypothetical protein LHA01_13580 [Schleiferilactobacillus harbinensis]